jgi:hypothetical protein
MAERTRADHLGTLRPDEQDEEEGAKSPHVRTFTATGMWKLAPWHVELELAVICAPFGNVSVECPGGNVSLRPVARLETTETPEVPGVVAVPLVHPGPPPVTATGPSWVTPISISVRVFGFVKESSSVPVAPGKRTVLTVAVACSTTTGFNVPTPTWLVPEPLAVNKA